jgi:hypothetical protein
MKRNSTKKEVTEKPLHFEAFRAQGPENVCVITTDDGNEDFDIPAGASLYCTTAETPKPGDLIVLPGGGRGARVLSRYNPRPVLATVNGKRVKGYKPFADIYAVVKYVAYPV